MRLISRWRPGLIPNPVLPGSHYTVRVDCAAVEEKRQKGGARQRHANNDDDARAHTRRGIPGPDVSDKEAGGGGLSPAKSLQPQWDGPS
ncbi:hypothetical protein MTO96_005285 [Rhipicephalus appendiculatus]